MGCFGWVPKVYAEKLYVLVRSPSRQTLRTGSQAILSGFHGIWLKIVNANAHSEVSSGVSELSPLSHSGGPSLATDEDRERANRALVMGF